jgi:hypothetical protein
VSEVDSAADQGRVAILAIDLRMLRQMAPGAILPYTDTHWDGDVWVQPETRFDIGALLRECSVPPSWHLVRRAWTRGVWIDPERGRLHILLASESFPVVREGTVPPYVTPIMQWVHGGNRSERVFVGWDMHEVMERSDAQ